MIERIARTKWCPQTERLPEQIPPLPYAKCIGSDCVLWVVTDNENEVVEPQAPVGPQVTPSSVAPRVEKQSVPAGYCGLRRQS